MERAFAKSLNLPGIRDTRRRVEQKIDAATAVTRKEPRP